MLITRKPGPTFNPVKVYLKSQEEVDVLSKLRRHKFTSINITLESQEEIDLIYSIFNFTPILDCFRGDVQNLAVRLHKGLDYVSSDNYTIYHSKLCHNLERKE